MALTRPVRAPASLAAALLLLAPAAASGQSAFAPGPGPWDPNVPTPAILRGFATGAGFSTYRDVERVVEGIAATTDRVRLESYGTSLEGRPLRLAWVSSPANLARLDSLKAANHALATGDGAPPGPDQPIFVWLSFGVHGDEPASTEAALEVLYRLAAGEDDSTRTWLDRAVVVVDPLLNPDGHERYVAWYRSVAGRKPDPDPGAREHRPPWPEGRTNHEYFDLNRDWAWGVQPETRARRAAYLATLPEVHVDFHEMGPESTYFFFPPAEPVHAFYPASTARWEQVFGDANAAAFDARGWAYYTAEDFDLFYPGYGDSWPSFFGATGMTYEQAGGAEAGLAIRRPDGTILTLAERVRHHAAAALTTIATAVAHREARLADFAAFWRDPGRVPADAPAAFLVPAESDARSLARLLADQGVEVDTLAAPVATAGLDSFPASGATADTLPPGTFLLRSDQPLGRYLAALMVPLAVSDTTLFYDITGWALPYLYDVPAWSAADPPRVPSGRWSGAEPAPPPDPPAGTVALAWPYRATTDVVAAARLAAAGRRVRVAERGFTAAGRRFPPGSFVLPVERAADLAPLQRAVVAAGARPVPLGSFHTPDGVDLGSDRVRPVAAPRIAIATGPATDPTSVGAVWHLLADEAGLEVRLVRLGDAAATPGSDPDSLAGLDRRPLDLSRTDVLILPDGPGPPAYAAAVGEGGVDRLRRWVQAGGTLIGVRAAARWLTADESGLTGFALAEEPEPTEAERREPEAVREAEDVRASIPGTLVAAAVDTTSALGWGYSSGVAPVLIRQPVEFALARSGNPWTYLDRPALAGYLPEAARKRLAGTPFALVERKGRGRVVLLADDPAFRGIEVGLKRLYLDAILLVPAARD